MFRLIKKTQNLLLSEQKTIFSSALIISFAYAISRLLGFVRYRIFAYYFTKAELDTFFASFRLPDIIFEVLVLGALSYSFVPIFIKWKFSTKQFAKNLSSLINVFFIFLLFISLIAFIFTPQFISLITPGFQIEERNQIIRFTRLLLITQVPFLTAGNILQLIAQAEKSFLITVIAPIAYNLSIILFTLLLAPSYKILAPIIGAAIGSTLFFLSQTIIFLKTSFKYSFTLKITKKFKEFFNLSFARILTLITKQIESTIELALASIIGSGAYTSLFLAQRLQFLPVSLIGQALGQASYPYITDLSESNKKDELSIILRNNLQMVFFLTLPIASIFIFSRTPLVRLFFGGPKFDWDATVSTAYTLSFFALAIPFHSSFYLLTRSFFSIFDAKTPLIINTFSMLLNIIFNLYFTLFLEKPIWFLALSFSISSFINTLLLLIFLNKEIKILNLSFFLNILKILISTFLSAFISYKFMHFLDGLMIETTTTLSLIILLTLTLSFFSVIYLASSWFFEVKEIYIIPKFIFKINEYKKKLIHFYTEIE